MGLGYETKKRRYKSRRERYEESVRNIKIIAIFFSIGLAVYIYMNRFELWAWLKTYFY